MSIDLPPCGPERDRLVAEALGELPYSHGYPPDAPCAYSTSNHAALDALEAWRAARSGRWVTIHLDGWRPSVTLGDVDRADNCSAPTLGDAASRAIIEAKRREG